jgi:hypothetical protein
MAVARPRIIVPAPRKPALPGPKPAARPRRPTPVLTNLLYTAGVIGVLLTVLPTALVLVIGGLPTLVGAIIDRHPRHYLTRCVGFLNFAGVAPYLVKIWMHHTVLAAMQMLTDPYVWLVMYGAAGVGWTIYLSAPSIAWLQVELMGTRRIKALQTRQHQLVSEWGEEVAEAAGAKAAGNTP